MAVNRELPILHRILLISVIEYCPIGTFMVTLFKVHQRPRLHISETLSGHVGDLILGLIINTVQHLIATNRSSVM